jgi:hypothetical protein
MNQKVTTTYFIQSHNIEIQEYEQDDSRTSYVQNIIQKHKSIFQDFAMGLPPQRRIEHIIKVK